MIRFVLPGLVLLGGLQAGCLVQVTEVKNPEPIFRQARAEAERLTGRPGSAHELNVLVFDPHDRQLVRVSVPLWLVRRVKTQVDGHVDWDDADLPGDTGRALARHQALRNLDLRELEKMGPGLLAEVDDEGSQVLVWLR